MRLLTVSNEFDYLHELVINKEILDIFKITYVYNFSYQQELDDKTYGKASRITSTKDSPLGS